MKKLTDLYANEVSVVKMGANKKKRFPIYKQRGVAMDEKIIKAVLEAPADGEEALDEMVKKAGIEDEAVPVIKGILRLLTGFKDKLPSETLSTLAKVAGYSEVEVEKEDEETNEGKMNLDGLSEELKKQLELVTKSQEEQIKALEAQNEATQKQLDVEKDARIKEIWKTKVEKDLSHYPGASVDEMVGELHELSKYNEKMAETTFGRMKNASEALKSSHLFGEVRKSVYKESSSTGAWGQLEKLADGLVEKSEFNMTKDAAVAKVLNSEKGKALYREYLAENEGQE